MENGEFKPLVSFPDVSDSFAHGFEAGMVWQRMIAGEIEIDNAVPYHSQNADVFEAMADAMNYDIEVKHLEDAFHEWCNVVFIRRPARRPKLTVVGDEAGS